MNRELEKLRIAESRETPFYYYDLTRLRETVESLGQAASKRKYHIHYALKANAQKPILEIIRNAGFGADCVSGGEVEWALQNGFASEKVFFAGVGKSDREIRFALGNEIGAFNVESIPELERIIFLSSQWQKTARIAIRINPNVNPNTHAYITTGLEENKFGINAWELDRVSELLRSSEHIDFIGLHFHIGSQITDLNVFRNLCSRVNDFQKWFWDRNFSVKTINLGGGLGVNYENPQSEWIPNFEAYFRVFESHLDIRPGQEVHFEPGRALVAHCGSLLTRVLYVKEGQKTHFVILDAGMTELLRPALYQAYHAIENLSSCRGEALYDVVGPICESSDCFGKSVSLPITSRGDIIEIKSTGAYGQTMASNYNLRPTVQAYFDE